MIIIALVNIVYEGKDITRDIAPFITAFTFTDNSGGQSDDISLTLQDRGSLWLNDWTPSKGDTIQAAIVGDVASLRCGAFETDEISYSMPPHILTIKAVSCAVRKNSRWENHNRSWENTTLHEIASDIAQSAGLSLFYDAEDFPVDRREQTHTADLPFIEELCRSYGLSVKVSDEKLIIFSEEDYSGHDAQLIITPDDTRLISARFTSKSAEIFRKAHVRYHHPVKDEVYEAEYEDECTEGSGRELEVYERVDSNEQALSVAKGTLSRVNSREITASLTLKGSPDFCAGVNVMLDGFGMFSGKYFIDKASHSAGISGWTVSLSLKMGGEAKKSVKKYKAHSRVKVPTSTASQGGVLLADDSEGY